MSAPSPTARTVQTLRASGWIADRVEQRLPIPGGRPVTKDAFGFGDVLAAHPMYGTLLVQATSRPNVNARITKATRADGADGVRPNPIRLNLLTWLRAGGRFEVWGWFKDKTTRRWSYRRVTVRWASDGDLAWNDVEAM